MLYYLHIDRWEFLLFIMIYWLYNAQMASLYLRDLSLFFCFDDIDIYCIYLCQQPHVDTPFELPLVRYGGWLPKVVHFPFYPSLSPTIFPPIFHIPGFCPLSLAIHTPQEHCKPVNSPSFSDTIFNDYPIHRHVVCQKLMSEVTNLSPTLTVCYHCHRKLGQ